VFGGIAGGPMRMKAWREIARAEWLKTASIRRKIEWEEFVIVPNPILAIVAIMECENEINALYSGKGTYLEPAGEFG
jgi:hypothetical protein